MLAIEESADGVAFDILVQPRASRTAIGPVHDRRLKVAVTSAPVDGAANAAVIKTLAKALACSRGAIEVVSGHSSRRKRLRITGVSRAAIEALL